MLLPAAVIYLVGINALSALAFWWDKLSAERGWWRVRERTLLMSAAAGGSIGALAAGHVLRHKTFKEPFRSRLRLIALAQVLLATLAVLGWLLFAR
jgi:uncharacterized membrane protein YsdA (DUF1294 family)